MQDKLALQERVMTRLEESFAQLDRAAAGSLEQHHILTDIARDAKTLAKVQRQIEELEG
jgi:hypothetical protein